MLIQHLFLDPLVVAPAVLGLLTIFGRKRKDEKPDETKGAQTLSQQTPGPSQGSSQTTSPSPSPGATTPVSGELPSSPGKKQPLPPPYPSPYVTEETSLNKLLQSLLQELPLPQTMGGDESSGMSASTPEYVPLRQTPMSRAMVIEPGARGKEAVEDEDEGVAEKRVSPVRMVKTPEPEPQQAKIEVRSPVVSQKREEPVEKAPKVEKPERLEKQAKEPARKETRTTQGFGHIFQLTQGNLETPGLVIINGSPGSGKTTLCSGLTDSYMKQGNPCLYVTYDQAPSGLREQMKKLGADPAPSESQFRFIIVDGYSSQSESFSMEPYYIEQPFDFDNIQETLVRNSGIFMGESVRVVFDSLDKLAGKVPQKEFVKKFGELVSKIKDSGATLIVTVDLSKLSKDFAGSLEELADCVIDVSTDRSNPNGRQLKVRRLNRASSKMEPETFEIDSGKGLVFA